MVYFSIYCNVIHLLTGYRGGILTNISLMVLVVERWASEKRATSREGLEVRLSSCLFGARRWDTLYQRQCLCSHQQHTRWQHLRILTSARSRRVLQIKTSRWSYLALSVWESSASPPLLYLSFWIQRDVKRAEKLTLSPDGIRTPVP